MRRLFDAECWDDHWLFGWITRLCNRRWGHEPEGMSWGNFCLFHSRYFANSLGHSFSRLCVADKLAFATTPRWLYLPMVRATGEIREYVENASKMQTKHFPTHDFTDDLAGWHEALRRYQMKWVARHRKAHDCDHWAPVPCHETARKYGMM
jgi:hypothetical protein